MSCFFHVIHDNSKLSNFIVCMGMYCMYVCIYGLYGKFSMSNIYGKLLYQLCLLVTILCFISALSSTLHRVFG